MKDKKYRIRETVNDWRVDVLAPKLKEKENFLREIYFDKNDFDWFQIDRWGNPIYPYRYYQSFSSNPIIFDTEEGARLFVEKLKRKLRIIEL